MNGLASVILPQQEMIQNSKTVHHGSRLGIVRTEYQDRGNFR
jgi:hypothetical protein